MYVRDLIALLEDMPEDAEVRFASQPSWPFEYSISSHADVVLVDLDNMPESREDEPDDEDALPEGARAEDIESWYFGKEMTKPCVYLAEGNQIGYLPGAVSCALGWH